MRDQPPSQDRFQTAMRQSADWLAEWESGELSDEVLAHRVETLVGDRDGARGFFVVAMTTELPLMDRLPEPLLLALRQAGGPVVDLTVRNLVMSTAMAVHHGRNADAEQREGSLRVQARARDLLRQLQSDQVLRRLAPMLAASRLEPQVLVDAEETSGLPQEVLDDGAMLVRWGYDQEQRDAIREALEAVPDQS